MPSRNALSVPARHSTSHARRCKCCVPSCPLCRAPAAWWSNSASSQPKAAAVHARTKICATASMPELLVDLETSIHQRAARGTWTSASALGGQVGHLGQAAGRLGGRHSMNRATAQHAPPNARSPRLYWPFLGRGAEKGDESACDIHRWGMSCAKVRIISFITCADSRSAFSGIDASARGASVGAPMVPWGRRWRFCGGSPRTRSGGG